MKTILTGLLFIAILISPQTVLAQPEPPHTAFNLGLFNWPHQNDTGPIFMGLETPQEPVAATKSKKPTKTTPRPTVYVVVAGDNLTKIGSAHKVEWQRIWAKNKSVKHPDRIFVGDRLTIPRKDEVLKKRPLPAAVSLPIVTPGASKPVPAAANYDAGNTYDYGYCTWYVKNRRGASLPNGLGNANTWFSRAQAMGLSTGYTPRVGAVGATARGSLGHVVYVEAVHKNGTITISEMNYKGWGVTSSRTASAGEFVYIY